MSFYLLVNGASTPHCLHTETLDPLLRMTLLYHNTGPCQTRNRSRRRGEGQNERHKYTYGEHARQDVLDVVQCPGAWADRSEHSLHWCGG